MKKIKILLPTLLTAATAATTLGFVTSCSQNNEIVRMDDVENLIANGWTRKTSIHDPITLEHGTNLTKWYLDIVKQNKDILRDDVMIDAFPKHNSLTDEEPVAKGSIGLEIGDIITGRMGDDSRLNFNLGFIGIANKLHVPHIPGVIEKEGFLTGQLSAQIKVTKMKVKVQRVGLFALYANYFESLEGAPYAKADLNQLICDTDWTVFMDVKWKGGITDTKEETPTIVDHEAKTYKFDAFWVSQKCRESKVIMQTLADMMLPQAFRCLEYMKNVKVSPN